MIQPGPLAQQLLNYKSLVITISYFITFNNKNNILFTTLDLFHGDFCLPFVFLDYNAVTMSGPKSELVRIQE